MAPDPKDPTTGDTRSRGDSDVERGGGGPAGVGPAGNSGQEADRAAADLAPNGDDPAHPDREEERLEEGLEETFPASDPVSAKHIT